MPSSALGAGDSGLRQKEAGKCNNKSADSMLEIPDKCYARGKQRQDKRDVREGKGS